MALKILLADDSMTAQNMARKILSDAGYEIVTVSNGAAALKKIAEITPDLVILDIYMPGYSGFEVCERVKRASENAPVLLSVGKLEPYREEDALAVHADGVIVKPFEATELLATVKAVLQGAPERTRAVVQLPAFMPDGGLEGILDGTFRCPYDRGSAFALGQTCRCPGRSFGCGIRRGFSRFRRHPNFSRPRPARGSFTFDRRLGRPTGRCSAAGSNAGFAR